MRQATAWHLSSAQPGRSLNSNLLLPECCKWEATEFQTQRRLFFFNPLASLPQSAASGSWNLRKSPGLSGLSLSQACRSFRGADLLALEVTYVWEKFTEPKTFRPKVGRGEPRRIDVLVRGAACSDKSKIHWPLCLWSRGKTAREKRKHKCFFFQCLCIYIYIYFLLTDKHKNNPQYWQSTACFSFLEFLINIFTHIHIFKKETVKWQWTHLRQYRFSTSQSFGMNTFPWLIYSAHLRNSFFSVLSVQCIFWLYDF